MAKYDDLLKEAQALNQRNYCGPLAIAVVANIELTKSLELFEKLGRNRRSGVFKYMYQQVLKDLGFTMREVKAPNLELLDPVMALSTNSVARNREAWGGKTYLARGDGHICAIVDGEVVDWTANRRMRIIELFEIVKVTEFRDYPPLPASK